MTPFDLAPLASPLQPAVRPDNDFAHAMLEGLRARPKTLPSKFFYDLEGSHLFERICDLPEYYVTRTELGLLHRHAGELAALIGPDAELVEFGAGSARKAAILLDALSRPRAYIPVDVSGEFLHREAKRLAARYPGLSIRPLIADFAAPLKLAPTPASGRRIGFFPGSTIGNFEPAEALGFLRNAAELLRGGAMLIGVDLVKNPARLHAAYNDGKGVTAAFNLNLLARANRELGARFELPRFAHHACYNPMRHRIEMYLISRVRHTVALLGREIAFEEGEAIHTEDSYKYTIDGFHALAARAGFDPTRTWTDPERLFSLHWLECS